MTERWVNYYCVPEGKEIKNPQSDENWIRLRVGSWQWAALQVAMGKNVQDMCGMTYPNRDGDVFIGTGNEPYSLVEERETFDFNEARKRKKQGKRVGRETSSGRVVTLSHDGDGYVLLYNGDTWMMGDEDYDATDWYEKDGE